MLETEVNYSVTMVLGILCWEKRSMTCIRTRDAPDILIFWEMPRVSGALSQELGAETNIYLLLCRTCCFTAMVHATVLSLRHIGYDL